MRVHSGDGPRALQEGSAPVRSGVRDEVVTWVGGLTGLVALAVPLVLVRVLVDDATAQRLATVALSSLVTAGVGALLWRTRRRHRDPGVAEHTAPPSVLLEPLPAWPRDAIRRARRRGVRGRLRRALPVVVLVLLPPAVVVGERAQEHHATLLRTQPVRTVEVVDVRRPPSPVVEPDIVVDVDGREVALFLGLPGNEDVEVGQLVDVVVDPADPMLVLATTSHDDWAYTWWGSVVTWGLVGGVGLALVCRRLPRRAAVRAARTVVAHRPARVVSRGLEHVVLDDGRERWVFEGQLPAGTDVVLLGDPAPGAWVVLDDGRTRLPREPLSSASEHVGWDEDDDGSDDEAGDGWDDEDDDGDVGRTGVDRDSRRFPGNGPWS